MACKARMPLDPLSDYGSPTDVASEDATPGKC